MATCPECGAQLRPGAMEGLCSRCLMLQGISLASTSPAPDAVGEPPDGLRRIGDYELLEEIARGGMGIVYRAKQRSLDRVVAVKTLLFGPNASPDYVKRFRAEASAAAALHHPGIVAIHEVGVHQGEHYLVMDLVEGPSLAKLVKEQPLPAQRAAGYLKSIAEAIHHAHERGVLHRDLKPSNVLIDANDQTWVTDFGLAKRMEGESSLTLSGRVLGSPSYMPPEQAGATGHKVGRRSDVYSLGAMLYDMLVGRPPFLGESLNQTLDQVFHREPISPRLLNPAVPRDLETICLKCLEKEPARRYPTAQSLADELSRFLRKEPIRARSISPPEKLWRWCRRKPVLAGLIVLVHVVTAVGLAGIVWEWRRAEHSAKLEAQQRTLALRALERAEAESLNARQNAYTSGILIAQRASEEGDFGRARELLRIHIPSPGQSDLRGFEWRYFWGQCHGDETATIATDADAWANGHLCLSPDDRFLAAGRRIWDLRTGTVSQTLLTNEDALAFGPQGHLLFLNSPQGFKRHDLSSGKECLMLPDQRVVPIEFSRTGRWLATGHSIENRGTAPGTLTLWDALTWERTAAVTNLYFDGRLPRALAFSPDETLLIAATGESLGNLGELRSFRVPSLEPVTIPTNEVRNVGCVVFSPDGREFFTGGWYGDARVWDTATLREIEERRQAGHHRAWISDLGFLPGMRTLVSVSADRCIHLWDPDGKAPVTTLRGHTSEICNMAVAHNSATFYTLSSDKTIKQWQALGATRASTLPTTARSVHLLGMSADSQTVATLSDGALDLWRISMAKQPPSQQHTAINGIPEFPEHPGVGSGMAAVSADLKWLVTTRTQAPLELWNIEQNQRQFLTTALSGVLCATFSPDSRLLVYARDRNVVVLNVSDRHEEASIPIAGWVDWMTPFVFAAHAKVLAIGRSHHVLLWDTERQRPLREIPFNSLLAPISFAISADGRQLAAGYTDDSYTLHDCRTGEQEGEPVAAHLSGVEWLCFSPDNRTLASASERWLKFWSLATRREVAVFDLPGKVISMAFSPDGNSFVIHTPGLIHIWHAPTLEAIQIKTKLVPGR